MKYIYISLFLIQFCSIAFAQEITSEDNAKPVSIPSDTAPQTNYQRYLSHKDKEDILSRRTKAKLREALKRNGRRRMPREIIVGEGSALVSIPVSFELDSESSRGIDDDKNNQSTQNAQATVVSSGNIVCTNLKALSPHAGEQFEGFPDVPKAKAEGQCQYEHLFGTPPPYIDFELRQMMLQSRFDPNFGEEFFVDQYFAVHPKRGLSVQWFQNGVNRTGTQVFGRCPPLDRADEFLHDFEIYVTPPPGYVYTGPVPFATAPVVRVNQVSC